MFTFYGDVSTPRLSAPLRCHYNDLQKAFYVTGQILSFSSILLLETEVHFSTSNTSAKLDKATMRLIALISSQLAITPCLSQSIIEKYSAWLRLFSEILFLNKFCGQFEVFLFSSKSMGLHILKTTKVERLCTYTQP